MTAIIIFWLGWNSIAGLPHFDSWTNRFLLLTLVLSIQASFAAPVILMAEAQQESRDQVWRDFDLAEVERLVTETQFLISQTQSIREHLTGALTRDEFRTELTAFMQSKGSARSQDRTSRDRV